MLLNMQGKICPRRKVVFKVDISSFRKDWKDGLIVKALSPRNYSEIKTRLRSQLSKLPRFYITFDLLTVCRLPIKAVLQFKTVQDGFMRRLSNLWIVR